MVPFAGIPFLAYSVCSLPPLADIVMIVNFREEQIRAYFGEEYAGRKIRYLRQVAPQGTGDALFQFAMTYRPTEPVIVWQADQLVYPDEVNRVLESQPNAVLYSDVDGNLAEIGLWKIKPTTLDKIGSHFKDGEYRALPIIETEGINKVRTARRKIELSFHAWDEIGQICDDYKQRFLIGYP
jgi:hypothetical protein